MEMHSILYVLVVVIGFYMAWNIGANDVSNAMATSVGSGALTLRRAVMIAAVFEFCGAYFVGSKVSETMEKGLINADIFSFDPLILALGMCGALLGTSLWLQLASYLGWPVSTTHAIVGAILGFGTLFGGWEALQWDVVISIAISWVISPLLSAIISYSIFAFLQKKILFAMDPIEATKKITPFICFFVLSTFTLNLIFNGLQNLHLNLTFLQAISIALLIGIFTGSLVYFFLKTLVPSQKSLVEGSQKSAQTIISLDKAIKHLQRIRVSSSHETHRKITEILNEVKSLSHKIRGETRFGKHSLDYPFVEKTFIYLQIVTACYVAFAHGANDVSNAIGPVAAVLDILKDGLISPYSSISSWLLLLGGSGIVLGLATWGWRVIETVGKKITALTPTRGFCAEFGAATTILLASKLGLPVSTTHCLVGAVLGVGLARGISALNLDVLKDIVLSWVITIPASAGMSIICFYFLKFIFYKTGVN